MINIKRFFKLFLLSSILLLTSGCFDYSELNNMDIIVGMGITQEDNQYEVTYEVINTGINKENTDAKKSYTVTGGGKTIASAIKSTTSKLNKKPYFEHMRIVLINSSLDILSLSDYFIRNNNISSNFYLVLTDDPKSLLEYTSQDKQINSEEVYNILNNINYPSFRNYFDFQVNDIISKKKDITIPYISLEDKLAFKSYGLYHQNKFITLLNTDNLNLYDYYLHNKNIILKNNNNSLNIYKTNYKIKITNEVNITLNIEASIDSLDTEIDLRKESSFKQLEIEFREVLIKEMTSYLKYLQSLNTDILGINNLNYLKTKNYSEDYFSQSNINLKINLKINRPGLTIRKVS